jgi:hypothetical protein
MYNHPQTGLSENNCMTAANRGNTSPRKRSRFVTPVIALVLALLIMPMSHPVGAAEPVLKDAIPVPGFSEEWTLDGKIEVFDKDTLFNHINGEAELYFPYGFDSLVSANYVSKKNQDLSIVADVYTMGSLLDAFGIYSNYRKPSNSWVMIGAEGFVSSSQLLFYQDRYFVRLQVSGETSLPQDTLLTYARAISIKLPTGSGQPKELETLKIPALVPKSERYLAQSLLGYAFFRKGIIADAALQNEKMQIFAILENTPADADRTFNQYYAYLKAEAQGVQLTESLDQRLIIAVDPLYGGVQVMRSGRYVIGAVRIKNNAAAKLILNQLRRRISAEIGG